MQITSDWLREQGACIDGIDWFLAQKEMNAIKVARKLITQNQMKWADWLLTHLMTRKQLTTYVIYKGKLLSKSSETQYLNNDRARKAIDAALVYEKHPSPETQSAARSAAWSAAYADWSAAYAEAAARSFISKKILVYGIKLLGKRRPLCHI